MLLFIIILTFYFLHALSELFYDSALVQEFHVK
jgi:hypothetical protein